MRHGLSFPARSTLGLGPRPTNGDLTVADPTILVEDAGAVGGPR